MCEMCGKWNGRTHTSVGIFAKIQPLVGGRGRDKESSCTVYVCVVWFIFVFGITFYTSLPNDADAVRPEVPKTYKRNELLCTFFTLLIRLSNLLCSIVSPSPSPSFSSASLSLATLLSCSSLRFSSLPFPPFPFPSPSLTKNWPPPSFEESIWFRSRSSVTLFEMARIHASRSSVDSPEKYWGREEGSYVSSSSLLHAWLLFFALFSSFFSFVFFFCLPSYSCSWRNFISALQRSATHAEAVVFIDWP